MTTTSRQIRLVEQDALIGIRLDHDQVVALSGLTSDVEEDGRPRKRRVLTLAPDSLRSHYTLTAGSVVGSISVRGLDLGIVPKAGVGKTAYMLAQGIGLAKWRFDPATYDSNQSVPDVLIPVFLQEVEMVIARGAVEDYDTVTEVGGKPRGRIDFAYASRFGLPLPLRYEFDELMADTDENRLLLHTLLLVGDHSALTSKDRVRARGLSRGFADVTWLAQPKLLDETTALPERIAHYRSALLLAGLIIEAIGLEPGPGRRRIKAVLFDMNKVFENYVTHLLKVTVPGGVEIDMQGVKRRLYLDQDTAYRLKPDFAFWRGSVCLAIGDVKYKIVDVRYGPRQDDLYQVAAYATAASTQRALLIYAGRRETRPLVLTHSGVVIRVLALDMDAPVSAIEEQLADAVAQLLLPQSN